MSGAGAGGQPGEDAVAEAADGGSVGLPRCDCVLVTGRAFQLMGDRWPGPPVGSPR